MYDYLSGHPQPTVKSLWYGAHIPPSHSLISSWCGWTWDITAETERPTLGTGILSTIVRERQADAAGLTDAADARFNRSVIEAESTQML